jgi:non-specific serine/threonine protein kinase/serine/threonine-protein kinase
MGVVWEAQRADQEYEQRVAIKLLPAGLLSAADVARFREERQILARLNHPCIARLLDGGTTEDGSPYLVMEYIEGERLDDWVARRRPALPEKLSLFLAVLGAVEYAHRRLVIHRDVKPANILLSAEGAVKLLDFGIARLVDTDASARADVTGALRRLTPEYASPEQVRGDTATTASDIYSLGVVLFRLVTGERPYSCDPEDSLAMLRAVCEEEPRLPSAVAALPKLRGEMDAIILQCLRKNPDERYPAVRSLADDIAAWLDGRPVAAHHPPWWRRSLRYVRRHKTQSAAAAAVVGSILAGTAISLWYARQAETHRQRAEARFNQVRRLAGSVVFEMHDAIADLPGSTRARQVLVERALQYLKDLEAAANGNPDLQLEIAGAYARLGEVQGNLGRTHLGDTQAAIASEVKARMLAREALRSNPKNSAAARILAQADERLVRLGTWQGDTRGIEGLCWEAAAILRNEAARDPGEPGLRAKALSVAADCRGMNANWAAALPDRRSAVDAYREALARDPGNSQLSARLAVAHRDLAQCWQETGNLPAALASYRQAQLLDLARAAAAPGAIGPQASLSFDLVEAGWVEHLLGRHREAIADYERSLAIQERLATTDPDDVWMRVEAAKLLNTAAPAYEAAGRRAKAVEVLRDAAVRLETAMAQDPANEDTRGHVGWVWLNLGDVYSRAGKWSEAASSYQRAIDTLKDMKFGGRLDFGMRAQPMLARAASKLAECDKRLGRR